MILALLLACAAQPGVLVVVTDTTRADLGGAAWPEWATPEAGARVYAEAWSASSWTGPSTTALLTGGTVWRPALRPVAIPPPVDGACWAGLVLSDNAWPAHAARHVCGPDTGRQVGSYDLAPGRRAAVVVEEARAAMGDYRALLVQPLGPHEPLPGTYAEAVADTLAAVEPLVAEAVADGWHVVWTSDHGEALGEGGRWGHGLDLADDQLRVPLVVWGPGVEPGTDDTPTGAHCVAATVRRILGEQDHGCDLRDGTITGEVVAGMCLAHDGYRCTQWIERRPGDES